MLCRDLKKVAEGPVDSGSLCPCFNKSVNPYLRSEILATLQVAPLITEHSCKGMSKMKIYGIVTQPRV